MRAHWKCSACLHEWQTTVSGKVAGKTGCPKCAKANGGRKADGTRQKHPTFAMAKHASLQQWDHDRNSKNGNFPDNTSLRSSKLIWWQCQECPKGKVHSWQAQAFSRTLFKRPTGCPCCFGNQLCECNSLQTVYPDIAGDFDAEKNGVTAAEVTSSAGTKYSWLSDEPGAKKRSVNQRTNYTIKRDADFGEIEGRTGRGSLVDASRCVQERVTWELGLTQETASGISSDSVCKRQLQKEQRKEFVPNISLLADKLQNQWHDKLNEHLGNVLIRPASRRKVWWSCDQCPDSFPHIWQATVFNRTYGTGCPFCSGMAICQHNTLARKAPDVARFWDAKKNHPMSPNHVTVSSNMRAHWKCSACLHEWQARVLSKVCRQTGCPKCAKANGGKKADGTRQKHPTFAVAKHALLQQWDHERNSKNGNFSDNTSLRSSKLIWWQCHECPKGKVHSWQAQAFSRTLLKKPIGCPCCAGKKLCVCNSLETVCPDIAADFDVEQNGVTAAEVTSSTTTKYSWLSDEPGAKKRSVNQRTIYTKKQISTTAKRS
ncbi:TPA: hypothetical protein ACH3X2_013536 [Trebouxia sp. C0005]